jgi:Leucine-rich repeat (LRR) protein
LSGSGNVTNRGLALLANLRTLFLDENSNITGKSLSRLQQLTRLSLRDNDNIYDDDIFPLAALTSLSLSLWPKITIDGLKGFTNLTLLDLGDCNWTMVEDAQTKLPLTDVVSCSCLQQAGIFFNIYGEFWPGLNRTQFGKRSRYCNILLK